MFIFQRNRVHSFGYGGGAIFTTLSHLELEGIVFKGNFAQNGGAVSSKDYVQHISTCNFYNNTAVIDGSALSFFGTDLSGLVVLNGTNDIQWNPGTISGLVILNGTNSFQWNQA